MIKLIDVIDKVAYYNVCGELIYFRLDSYCYQQWLHKVKSNKRKIDWLRHRGLID